MPNYHCDTPREKTQSCATKRKGTLLRNPMSANTRLQSRWHSHELLQVCYCTSDPHYLTAGNTTTKPCMKGESEFPSPVTPIWKKRHGAVFHLEYVWIYKCRRLLMLRSYRSFKNQLGIQVSPMNTNNLQIVRPQGRHPKSEPNHCIGASEPLGHSTFPDFASSAWLDLESPERWPLYLIFGEVDDRSRSATATLFSWSDIKNRDIVDEICSYLGIEDLWSSKSVYLILDSVLCISFLFAVIEYNYTLQNG